MAITTLIDKQDTFEIVRDQIAIVLATEVANQMTLATNAGKDPALWDLRIFKERTNPWEQFLNLQPGDEKSRAPIVNIWFDNSNFEMGASNLIDRQKATSIFNIDCYGYGESMDDGATGHTPGDLTAALEVQRAVRLVRNILMAAEYTYLGFSDEDKRKGFCWLRWPQSITQFQPQLDSRRVQQVVGSRIAFQVGFNEFSPQIEPVTLEIVDVKVFKDTIEGQLLLEAEYDYTL